MAQLAVGVEFLSEYSRLEKQLQRLTDKALRTFSEHTHAGLHLEKIRNSRDPRMRTIRIDQFWRGLVVAPERGDRYTLLHVMSHDDAIAWAQGHQLTVNEVTGVVEISDVATLEQLADPPDSGAAASLLFAQVSDADLRRLGIDARVLAVTRTMVDAAALDAIVPLVPENQADVLQALAAGYEVEQVWADVVAPRIPDEPIDTDDLDAAVARTSGRIALVEGPDELITLFAKPLALWRVFLHPSQDAIAYRPTYWGSAQVTGGPGTGKTVVALHRVKHLVESRDLPPKSVLLTTYTRGLAEALERDLAQLLEPAARPAVQVMNVDSWAVSIVGQRHGKVIVATDNDLRERVGQAAERLDGTGFTAAFLLEEWRQVVLANGVRTLDEYLVAPRRGRGLGLSRTRKQQVWAILDRFGSDLRRDRLWTWPTLADEAARLIGERGTPPFRHVVVDEVQDLHPAQWRLLRAAVAPGPDDLFLTGDPHQRIYGNHVSLRRVGISVMGRSTRLRINYRTSAEILRWSLGVLGDIAIADLDEGLDSLTGYRSTLHGTDPELVPAASAAAEAEDLALAIEQWREDGVEPGDVAVVARTRQLARQVAADLRRHGLRVSGLGPDEPGPDAVHAATMHGMKGLEFRCVAITAVSADALPQRVAVTPMAEDPVRHALDLQQERCLLFVACTRARERLRISWSGRRSDLVPS